MEDLKKALLPFIPPPLQRVRWRSLGLLVEAVGKAVSAVAGIVRAYPLRAAGAMAWIVAFLAAHAHGFGGLFFILSGFAFIFSNLSSRDAVADGEQNLFRSAYSVFNQGGRAMLGSLTAEQFENQLRHRGPEEDEPEGKRGDGGDADDGAEESKHPRGDAEEEGWEVIDE